MELAGLGWGFKRIAGAYTARTGEYLSHATVRDRLASMRQRALMGVEEAPKHATIGAKGRSVDRDVE